MTATWGHLFWTTQLLRVTLLKLLLRLKDGHLMSGIRLLLHEDFVSNYQLYLTGLVQMDPLLKGMSHRRSESERRRSTARFMVSQRHPVVNLFYIVTSLSSVQQLLQYEGSQAIIAKRFHVSRVGGINFQWKCYSPFKTLVKCPLWV